MHFLVALCTLAALQSAQAQIQKKDPSVCDGAKKRNGIGFNPHPNDCTQFVQCFYFPRGKVEPVYRNCEYGYFWDHDKMRCLPADTVNCPHDKCKKPGVDFYKHSDPNKCGAYWKCQAGKAYGKCCPEGQGFHPKRGCIPSASCVDMCPLQDRVPGCQRRPISGSPSRFEQYTDNGVWQRERCPKGSAYNPADCECSIKDIIGTGKICKPDVVMRFDTGRIEDLSGNKYPIEAVNVTPFKKAAYFKGNSKLVIPPLRPSKNDEGVLIIKMKFREDKRRGARKPLQAMLTNGHCGKEASVLVAKFKDTVLLGAEANMSRSFPLPIVNKPWKEVIYIHDRVKLEGRVCGATYNDWCVGELKHHDCGFQIGAGKDMAGFYGLIDDISIYRCKPLEAVVNLNY